MSTRSKKTSKYGRDIWQITCRQGDFLYCFTVCCTFMSATTWLNSAPSAWHSRSSCRSSSTVILANLASMIHWNSKKSLLHGSSTLFLFLWPHMLPSVALLILCQSTEHAHCRKHDSHFMLGKCSQHVVINPLSPFPPASPQVLKLGVRGAGPSRLDSKRPVSLPSPSSVSYSHAPEQREEGKGGEGGWRHFLARVLYCTQGNHCRSIVLFFEITVYMYI